MLKRFFLNHLKVVLINRISFWSLCERSLLLSARWSADIARCCPRVFNKIPSRRVPSRPNEFGPHKYVAAAGCRPQPTMYSECRRGQKLNRRALRGWDARRIAWSGGYLRLSGAFHAGLKKRRLRLFVAPRARSSSRRCEADARDGIDPIAASSLTGL